MPDPTVSIPVVRTFHQILFWPLQLVPLKKGSQVHHHWELLEKDAGRVWKEVDDEFCADPDGFKERHYREFVTFLPFVQRILYGEGAKSHSMSHALGRSMAAYGESSIKVFRRTDVTTARVVFPGRDAPVVFDIRHVDLYFFRDVDLAILVVEISGSDVPLDVVQDSCTGLAAPILRVGPRRAMASTAPARWNGWRRMDACSRCRTTRPESRIWRRYVASGRRSLRRIGNICSTPWCRITPISRELCGSVTSNITACR